MASGDRVESRFVTALRTQSKAESHDPTLPCPYSGHHNRIFQNLCQLFDHAKADHSAEIQGQEPRDARRRLKEAALKLRRSEQMQMSEPTAGDRSTPDIAALTLDPKMEPQSSPPLRNKRPAESEPQMDADFSRKMPSTIPSDRSKPKSQDHRLYNPKHELLYNPQHELLYNPKHELKAGSPLYQSTPELSADRGSPLYQSTPKLSADRPTDTTKTIMPLPNPPARHSPHRLASKQQHSQRQPGLIELQRYDPRYPGLLLQPDSRPISQEQLASEVKSIYAGLTMVEDKCKQVDQAQDNSHTKLASDHWQALIALHRTLLHEHHDFFLASQHPSASPALRRLAAKYTMPARMWKHGIHSFLELLRRRLPDSIDYMLAFIYLAYQILALLYETVPAFEDTWIECLGDLGRYRMAIEDEDIRDRETWAGVARSWYTKAADKNPTVGRLYHHLAILARPNALQQLYYYARSLTCVRPFASARDSILILLDPILGRTPATYSHALPIDTSFIKAHALLFERMPGQDLEASKKAFLQGLDSHIGRVTAKWKEQGVYIAVTNLASWFEYGKEGNLLRDVFLTELQEKAKTSPPDLEETLRTASPADQQDPSPPSIPEDELPDKVYGFTKTDATFFCATAITNETFALVLRRIGDKNVLPHVHVMLSYLTKFASNEYVSYLLDDMPWAELAAFLNTLVKTESQAQTQNPTQAQDIDALVAAHVFPGIGERTDELPLPEDYLIRGLIWAHDYYPRKWFEREHDEEERYLELASTVKCRIERVLRLGYQLTKHNTWISYEPGAHTFSVLAPPIRPRPNP